MDRLPLLPPGGAAPASAYLARLAPRSQVAMRRALAKVAVLVARFPTKDGRPLGGYARVDLDRVPWAALDAARLAWLREQLSASATPASVRQALVAVRGVLGVVGVLDAERMAVTRVPKVRTKRERAEWQPAPSGGAPGVLRDAALGALVHGLGLRPGVVVALDLADFRGWRLDLRQRERVRAVRVPDPISDAIEAWIAVRGSHPGPLLLGVNKGGRTLGRLTSGAAQKRLARNVVI